MTSLILSTLLLVAVVGGLGGWMIRKDRRLREEARRVADLEDAYATNIGEERDARHHRQRA